MSIEIRTTYNSIIDKGVLILANTQDPYEGAATNAANMLNRYLKNQGITLQHLKPGIPQPSDFSYISDLYKKLLEKTNKPVTGSPSTHTPGPQELRELALKAAEKALADALANLRRTKEIIDSTDRIYRSFLSRHSLRTPTGRRIRDLYQERTRAFLKARREWLKAKKACDNAKVQVWKRNPDKCPGSGWVWVRTYQSRSRTGTSFTVEGYWRAPRKPKTTADEIEHAA